MPAKFERCVKKVRKQSTTKNPYAICNASIYGKRKSYAVPKFRGIVGLKFDRPLGGMFRFDYPVTQKRKR